MKHLILKTSIYIVLIFISLEIIVRVFHLYNEPPIFIINNLNLKTYAPNQNGYSVTGNRKMNFAQYHINKSGFNSYREFKPSKDKIDIAIIGDSFIEGLHQNYNNSIGKKIESKLNNSIEVFEYGHAGYDFADQLYLMSAYKEKFELIDNVIVYLKYENDLKRNFYEPNQYWVDSQYFTSRKIGKKIKLFTYMENIGFFEPLRDLKRKIVSLGNDANKNISSTNDPDDTIKNLKYLNNFKALISKYGFNKNKTAFLLDKRKTSRLFLDYLDQMNYKYIDFGEDFEKSKVPTNLIYDMHWNNHGRDIIASVITKYIKEEK